MKRVDGVGSRCVRRGDLRRVAGQTRPAASRRSVAGNHAAANSRSSGSASTTSRRSRRRKTGSARRSTARAAPSATAFRRLAAPAWSPRCARRAATSDGEFVELVADVTVAVPDLLDSHAHVPADHPARGERDLAARADPVVWRGPRRSDPRRDAAGARRSAAIAIATASAGGRPIITDIATGQRRVGRFGWKAQHATLLAFGADAYRNEMGITNDLFPDELAFGITPEQMKLCDRDSRSGRPRGSADAAPRHRQFRGVHEVPRAGRARADRRHRARRRGAVRRRRLRLVPRAVASDRARARTRCSIARSCRCSRICCCTTSGPATASGRKPPSRRSSGRRRCGGCGCGGRCCTTARAATIEDAIGVHGRRGGVGAARAVHRALGRSARGAARVFEVALKKRRSIG